MFEPQSYAMFVDGASRGNPGPASIGVSIVDANQNEFATLSECIGVETNNVAEYQALIRGLKLALKKKIKNISVYSDSQLMVRQIQGIYKVKNETIKILVLELKKLIEAFETFSIEHIYRDKNKRADELANLALDESAARESSLSNES